MAPVQPSERSERLGATTTKSAYAGDDAAPQQDERARLWHNLRGDERDTAAALSPRELERSTGTLESRPIEKAVAREGQRIGVLILHKDIFQVERQVSE